MSDVKLARSGYMLSNKPDYPRVSSWPHLIWIIFLCTIFLLIMIWGISFIFDAPLEEEAAWAKTPNPAKAPWYFIGLQEMLVYFDPWIAGVLLPTQILIGLMLIPFVDISPHAQGRYGWKDRKFAVSFFSFGMFFWFALIAVGQWFRGPSWEFYWPYFDYPIGGTQWVYAGHALKVTTAKLFNMPNTAGVAFIVIFFSAGMVVPLAVARLSGASKIGQLSRDYIEKLGMIRYFIVQSHVVLTMFVLAKIALRLTIGYKYMVATPWFNI